MCPKLGRIFLSQEVFRIAQKKQRETKATFKTKSARNNRKTKPKNAAAQQMQSAYRKKLAQSGKEKQASNEYAVDQTQQAAAELAHDGLKSAQHGAQKAYQRSKAQKQAAEKRQEQNHRQKAGTDPASAAPNPAVESRPALDPVVPSYQEQGVAAFREQKQNGLPSHTYSTAFHSHTQTASFSDKHTPKTRDYLRHQPPERPGKSAAAVSSNQTKSYQERGAAAFQAKRREELKKKSDKQVSVQDQSITPPQASIHNRPSITYRSSDPQKTAIPTPTYQEQGRSSFIRKKEIQLKTRQHYEQHHDVATRPLERNVADPIHDSQPLSYQESGRKYFIQKRQKEMRKGHLPIQKDTPVCSMESMLPEHSGSEKAVPVLPKAATEQGAAKSSRTDSPSIKKKEKTAPKRKPQAAIKTKAYVEQNTGKHLRPSGASTPPLATARSAQELGRKQFKKTAQRKMAQQAQATAKRTASLSKQVLAAVTKTIRAGFGLLAGLVGGTGIFVILCVVLLVGSVIASPFGILFSNEPAEGAIPLSAAVAQINMEYFNRLIELQEEEDYEEITIEGEPPDWVDVICVFASKVAGAEDGMDVAVLDEERVELLRETFWDMCTIEVTVEKPEPTLPVGSTTATTAPTEPPKPSLEIQIIAKTVDEMRLEYSFTNLQNDAVDLLLEETAAIEELMGSVTITQGEALEVLSKLPEDTSAERKEVVTYALSLVGKVNYFWGGKSLVLGWDSRWGQLTKVTAPGSPTTGTMRPYGMDCSGFVDWAFYNASGGSYVLGHGGGVATQHIYCHPISWSEAQPGDLAFYPDDSHAGIVGGRDESGNLLIIHCASGLNNVVITGQSGFGSVGRPMYFD